MVMYKDFSGISAADSSEAGLAGPRHLSFDEVADRVAGLDGAALVHAVLQGAYASRIALVSSFGTESAVLLALVADVAPNTPVLFLDTAKHFPETLEYRDQLVQRLGLTDIRDIHPDPQALLTQDPDGQLNQRDPDACCALRKVAPLRQALLPFEAWISGRKRFQGGNRLALPTVEWVDGKVKINPLAGWSYQRIQNEFDRRDLPRHPLEAFGYLSVGCAPCTKPTPDGAETRAGRWAGRAKTECGIHFPTLNPAS